MNADELAFERNQAEVIREFQRRRQATMQACAKWVAMMLVLVCGLYALGDVDNPNGWRLTACAAICIGLGVTGWRIYRITQDKLRCPNCDVVPKDKEGYIPNPTHCSFCGMKLK